MYDAGVTQQKVEELARAANWQPEYHSPETCQAARRFFQDLTQHDAKGRPQGFKRALSRSESEWIANERRLCKLDFNYFATRYAYIRHWNTSLTLFDPNLPQRIKLAGYAEQEARGVAIMALNLKARQHGSSTLDELICGHRATFWAQTYSIVGSSDPEKSRKMFNMVELMWEHMPWWLKPEITSYSAGERVEFGKMNSIISIQHGTQTSDIGRGDTPNVIHLSELNDFDRPGELIDAGLMRAIHQSPSIFMILECTGTGRGTWWHKKWESCVADGEYAQFTPTFLPWFLGTDKYPTPDWLKRYPRTGVLRSRRLRTPSGARSTSPRRLFCGATSVKAGRCPASSSGSTNSTGRGMCVRASSASFFERCLPRPTKRLPRLMSKSSPSN